MLLPELRSNGCGSGAKAGFLLGRQQSPLGRRQERVGRPTYQASALQTGSMLEPLCFSQPGGGAERARSAPPAPRALRGGGGGGARGYTDAEADMPSAETSGAICVQRFDDSRNSAIHTTYRISLRSSSIREPRYPLLRVVIGCERAERADRHDASA